jgi:hypothetical protein
MTDYNTLMTAVYDAVDPLAGPDQMLAFYAAFVAQVVGYADTRQDPDMDALIASAIRSSSTIARSVGRRS